MRKLCFLLLLTLLISACSGKTEGWNEVEVPGHGVFLMPPGWSCETVDKLTYIKCGESVLMIGSEEIYYTEFLSDYFEKDVKTVLDKYGIPEFHDAKLYSNGAHIVIGDFLVDGEPCELIEMHLLDTGELITFVVVDPSISYDTMKTIGKTYERFYSEKEKELFCKGKEDCR